MKPDFRNGDKTHGRTLALGETDRAALSSGHAWALREGMTLVELRVVARWGRRWLRAITRPA